MIYRNRASKLQPIKFADLRKELTKTKPPLYKSQTKEQMFRSTSNIPIEESNQEDVVDLSRDLSSNRKESMNIFKRMGYMGSEGRSRK